MSGAGKAPARPTVATICGGRHVGPATMRALEAAVLCAAAAVAQMPRHIEFTTLADIKPVRRVIRPAPKARDLP